MDLVIGKNTLKKYVDLVSLSGVNQIKEAILNVTPSSIKTLASTTNKAVGVRVEQIGKYEQLGEIGIDDLQLLGNVVSSIQSEDVKLSIKANKVNVSAGKARASLMLRNKEYIKNSIEEEKFAELQKKAKGNSFTLTKEQITTLLQTLNIIKSSAVRFSGKGKTLTATFPKLDNSLEVELELDKEVKPFDISLDVFFLQLLSTIGDTVTLSMQQDVPIVLVDYQSKTLNVTYLVAPLAK